MTVLSVAHANVDLDGEECCAINVQFSLMRVKIAALAQKIMLVLFLFAKVDATLTFTVLVTQSPSLVTLRTVASANVEISG